MITREYASASRYLFTYVAHLESGVSPKRIIDFEIQLNDVYLSLAQRVDYLKIASGRIDACFKASICLRPTRVKTYTVNKSSMAFKKRGKESYNEETRRCIFTISVTTTRKLSGAVELAELDALLQKNLLAGFNCVIQSSRILQTSAANWEL